MRIVQRTSKRLDALFAFFPSGFQRCAALCLESEGADELCTEPICPPCQSQIRIAPPLAGAVLHTFFTTMGLKGRQKILTLLLA
ncbi:hypothetical protein Y032_0069g320 [Ancylostoma ceylanicum]|uniref:Uncharacterized protein n=1 Tax=Ancylostoma ceylanicum TaxID=53326 RepID=A0A016TYF4_9BILA|nr:hypothetical protein Y032_0069g320 [Ancylostoma ceylanicum]